MGETGTLVSKTCHDGSVGYRHSVNGRYGEQ